MKGLEGRLEGMDKKSKVVLNGADGNIDVCGYIMEGFKKSVYLSLEKNHNHKLTKKADYQLEQEYSLSKFDDVISLPNPRWISADKGNTYPLSNVKKGDIIEVEIKEKSKRGHTYDRFMGFVYENNSHLKLSLTSPFNLADEASLLTWVHVRGNNGDYIETTKEIYRYRILRENEVEVV